MYALKDCALCVWQVLSNREKKAMEEEKDKLSGTLMVALPDLISKVNILARVA